MQPVELRLTLGRYQVALTLQRRPEPLPVQVVAVTDVTEPARQDTVEEARYMVRRLGRDSMGSLVVAGMLGVIVAGLLFVVLPLPYPWSLLAAFYIVVVALIVGMPHVLPRIPLKQGAWMDFAVILSPRIYPWASVMFAVVGAVAAISASNESYDPNLRAFLNALAYLIPVVGLMVEANKSFAEAAKRELPRAGTFREQRGRGKL